MVMTPDPTLGSVGTGEARKRSGALGRPIRASHQKASPKIRSDDGEDGLAERRGEGLEVGAVEQDQPSREDERGPDHHPGRGADPRPTGLDPQLHGRLVPSGGGQGAQEFGQPSGLVAGGQHQGGHDEVSGRVGQVVGEAPQGRYETFRRPVARPA